MKKYLITFYAVWTTVVASSMFRETAERLASKDHTWWIAFLITLALAYFSTYLFVKSREA